MNTSLRADPFRMNRRIGRWNVPYSAIVQRDPATQAVQATLQILHMQPKLTIPVTEIIALCDQFEISPEGSEAPTYTPLVHRVDGAWQVAWKQTNGYDVVQPRYVIRGPQFMPPIGLWQAIGLRIDRFLAGRLAYSRPLHEWAKNPPTTLHNLTIGEDGPRWWGGQFNTGDPGHG